MKPHPWNSGFTWEATGNDQFDELGFFVLDDAIDPAELAEVTAAIDPFEERTTEFLRTQPDGKLMIADAEAITFTTHLVTRSPRLRAFATAPVFQRLSAELAGPTPTLWGPRRRGALTRPSPGTIPPGRRRWRPLNGGYNGG